MPLTWVMSRVVIVVVLIVDSRVVIIDVQVSFSCATPRVVVIVVVRAKKYSGSIRSASVVAVRDFRSSSNRWSSFDFGRRKIRAALCADGLLSVHATRGRHGRQGVF